MADRLAALFTHFAVRAETFQVGPLCGVNSLEPQAGRGQLHLIREGGVEVHNDGTPEPSTAPGEPAGPRSSDGPKTRPCSGRLRTTPKVPALTPATRRARAAGPGPTASGRSVTAANSENRLVLLARSR